MKLALDDVYFLGPPLEKGPLPAFMYFALSAKESLELSPFNSPSTLLASENCRVFSTSLPFHDDDSHKHDPFPQWIKALEKGDAFLDAFFEKMLKSIETLIEEKIIDPKHLAFGGLSRGGFIATNLAAKEKRCRFLLAFAPVTTLKTAGLSEELAERTSLKNCAAELLHLQGIRFYIGNRDTRVSTQECFDFIITCADHIHHKRIRHLPVELFIKKSIGNQGHGTPLETFFDGAEWIKKQFLGGPHVH